jgi:hypothetical protein
MAHILSLAPRGGSSVGQSSGLIIRRSQVRALPAPPLYQQCSLATPQTWGECGANRPRASTMRGDTGETRFARAPPSELVPWRMGAWRPYVGRSAIQGSTDQSDTRSGSAPIRPMTHALGERETRRVEER